MAFSDLKDDLSYGYENNRFYSQSIFKGLACIIGLAAVTFALFSGLGALGIGAFGATAAISTAASFIGVPTAISAVASMPFVTPAIAAIAVPATAGIVGAVVATKNAPEMLTNNALTRLYQRRFSGDKVYSESLKELESKLKAKRIEEKAQKRSDERSAKLQGKEAKSQYQQDYQARHDILDKKGIFRGKDRTDKLSDALKGRDPIKISEQIGKLSTAVNGVHLNNLDKLNPKQAGKSVAAVTKALEAVNKALTSAELNSKVRQELQTLKGNIEQKLNTAATDIGRCDDQTKLQLQQSVRSSKLKGDDRWSNLSEFKEAMTTSQQIKEDQQQKEIEAKVQKTMQKFSDKQTREEFISKHSDSFSNTIQEVAAEMNVNFLALNELERGSFYNTNLERITEKDILKCTELSLKQDIETQQKAQKTAQQEEEAKRAEQQKTQTKEARTKTAIKELVVELAGVVSVSDAKGDVKATSQSNPEHTPEQGQGRVGG
jgi:Skp family chaperone for outer membrane proteins